MDIEKVKKELSTIGQVVVFKTGKVFTLLMTGANFQSHTTVKNIQDIVLRTIAKKYPFIEVMHNEENFFLLILKE